MVLCWEGQLGVLSMCHVPGLDSLDAMTKNVSRRCHVSPKVGGGRGSGAELSPVENHWFKGAKKTWRFGWDDASLRKAHRMGLSKIFEFRADRI